MTSEKYLSFVEYLFVEVTRFENNEIIYHLFFVKTEHIPFHLKGAQRTLEDGILYKMT